MVMQDYKEKLNDGFESKFHIQYKKEKNGCWVWQAGKTDTGYGMFWTGKRTIGAHRISYVLHKGLIPKGMCIDHLCKNRACVNPDHMEVVTRGENARRGDHAESKKTHCAKGHPYDEKNTYWYRNHRICRTCARKKWYKWFLKNKNHRNEMLRKKYNKEVII